jgi:predicted dienelactone hydrolase
LSQVKIGLIRLEAAKDCPVAGSALPLIVISHGYSGKLTSHHDTAEALANESQVRSTARKPDESNGSKIR